LSTRHLATFQTNGHPEAKKLVKQYDSMHIVYMMLQVSALSNQLWIEVAEYP